MTYAKNPIYGIWGVWHFLPPAAMRIYEKMRKITMMNLILEIVLSRDLSRLTEPVKRMIKWDMGKV